MLMEIACFQVVGNLIYYRYMNPAIVAPDAFDVVSFGVDKGLTPDQVRQRSFISEKEYDSWIIFNKEKQPPWKICVFFQPKIVDKIP